MQNLKKIPLFVFLVLILTACGVKILPKDTSEGVVNQKNSSVTIEKERIRITVKSMAWKFSPSYLEDYYTPLYIIVRNETDKGIDLRYKDFILFDDKGNQFIPISPEKVRDSFLGYELYSSYRTFPGPYNFWEDWWRPYWYTRPWPYYPSPYYRDYGYPYDMYNLHTDVIPHALPEGDIFPNAQVRGFLYFQKATEFGKELKLKVSTAGLTYNFVFEIRGRGKDEN